MWKPGDEVTVTGFNKHKVIVKECQFENHRIIANCQRARFKEAKENLPEDCYLISEGIADVSRA